MLDNPVDTLVWAQGVEVPQEDRVVQVEFSDDAYEALAKMAKARGVPVEEVLSDALGLEQFAVELRKDGGKLLAKRPGVRRLKEVQTS